MLRGKVMVKHYVQFVPPARCVVGMVAGRGEVLSVGVNPEFTRGHGRGWRPVCETAE